MRDQKVARNWGLKKKGGRELKRAFIQVPYAVLSRLLFKGQSIGIYRVGDDSPGPNGYVEFIVYGDDHTTIERGAVYQLRLSRRLVKQEDKGDYS